MTFADFHHLVLLVSTNPLPNFVVAEFFLQAGIPIHRIWLIHSEDNKLQTGTSFQTGRLERLLRSRWKDQKPDLQFERISLSDVGDGQMIRRDIRQKMLSEDAWQHNPKFHLNYTGGTKAMATHVYLQLQEKQERGERCFSYLDANNFRLLLDEEGLFPLSGSGDLRQKVHISFADLIQLHGFKRKNSDKDCSFDPSHDRDLFNKFCVQAEDRERQNGKFLERYLFAKIQEKFSDKLREKNEILMNWEIRKQDWRTYFELDIILMQGYQLTGMSCTINDRKGKVKLKGFEIIHRCRQIGGDEAKAIIVSGLEGENRKLQQELEYETGGTRKNILALGLAELRDEKIYLKKIEEFIFS
ncbi:MAG TPA: hypothetical protein ENJ30_01915 [Desulfobulbaceae bacterium]|nr:hypothetical protein [Desulfobulbaceae bacterium]